MPYRDERPAFAEIRNVRASARRVRTKQPRRKVTHVFIAEGGSYSMKTGIKGSFTTAFNSPKMRPRNFKGFVN